MGFVRAKRAPPQLATASKLPRLTLVERLPVQQQVNEAFHNSGHYFARNARRVGLPTAPWRAARRGRWLELSSRPAAAATRRRQCEGSEPEPSGRQCKAGGLCRSLQQRTWGDRASSRAKRRDGIAFATPSAATARGSWYQLARQHRFTRRYVPIGRGDSREARGIDTASAEWHEPLCCVA